MRKTCFSLIAAFAVAGVATPALAETVTIRVSTEGFDLSQADDIAEIERRVEIAAREACMVGRAYSMTQQAGERACYEDLIDGAAEQIERRREIALEAARLELLAVN